MKCSHSIQYLTKNKDSIGHHCIRCNPDKIKAIKYKIVNGKQKIEEKQCNTQCRNTNKI